MLLQIWEAIIGFLKGKPYWNRVKPIIAIVSLYLTSVTLAYQYVEWRYGLSPPLPLYLGSYLFREATLAFLAFVVIASAVFWREKSARIEPRGGFREAMHGLWRTGVRRAVVAGIALAAILGLGAYWSPAHAGTIRVAFLGKADVDAYALAYVVYELNRLRPESYLKMDFDSLDETILTDQERTQCGADPLCITEKLSEGAPTIAITARGLGSNSFWINHGKTSVVSTEGWEAMSPPGIYEYAAYSILVQSVLIHLNESCGGVPPAAFQKGWVAFGDLFEFAPRRQTMKAAILAPHLGPQDQQRLANCFGIAYLGSFEKVLGLEWLRDPRVQGNLEKSFGVKN